MGASTVMNLKLINLLQIVSYRAESQSDKQAYIFLQNGETELASLTYRELDRQARAIAAHLQPMQGERALLLYPSGLEFIIAFFGCLYAGVVAVPLYPPKQNQKLSRLLSIVNDAQAKIALTTTSVLADIEKRWFEEPELAQVTLVVTDTIETSEPEFVSKSVTPESLAFLQYTSGSTGTPKGVMVTHGNIIHNQQIIYQAFGHSEKSIGVCWLPLFHDMGLIGHILQPIYGGCTSILMPPVAFLQQPVRWLSAISRYKATTSGGPNFAYDLCIKKVQPEELANLDLSSWEVAFNGAEPVKAETLKQFSEKFASCGFSNKAFYPCYGMAETTLFATGGNKHQKPVIQGVKAQDLEHNFIVETEISSKESRVFVGVGRPYMDTKVMIVNSESLTISQERLVGEIWVSGGSIACGYWNRPQSTQETFQAYLKDTGDGPFLRTGDLGFFNNGELFITGRLKDVIIINGRNYYPQDIELTVENSHPALRSHCSAAFSREIAGEECLVVACEVERTYLRKLNTLEVVRAIQIAVSTEHELEVYGVVLLNLGSIPKTSSGKIQRQACKQGFLEKSLNVIGQWQKTIEKNPTIIGSNSQENGPENLLHIVSKTADDIEAWLANKIAEILQITSDKIDLKQPLAIYGLNSVKAVSIAAELEQWLGISITPTIVYDYPSIQALADYLGHHTSPIKSSIVVSNQKTTTEAVAIIGIGCRFPQANNPQAFWSLLRSGVDAITKVPVSRWELDNGWGGFLDQVDQFDPQFFNISPREASNMDPQQRLLLEVSWEALENAGLPAQQLAGIQGGVFIGISNVDYAKLQGNLINTEAYYGTGNAFSIAANRLSYFLDWHGPSFAVDTACSSSLVAVHQACQSLLLGECNLALAGGVNLMLSPQLTLTFSEAQMMAADGRCKAFDALADGYVRSEGCGVIVLKRLADALADGDNIQAIIKGSAVNQDGLTNGLTAPNGNFQQQVIRLALAKARVKPNQISYVETHGTGTALGDPIEVNSLKAVLMEGRESNQICWLGSVKTNIGHLEAAAGIAGLIKIVLSLQHSEIPPHLHLKQLNPYIEFEKTTIEIPTQLQPWLSVGEPRLAGVSAFGFGGTNAHVILEEASVQVKKENLLKRPVHVLTLSAKTEKALDDLVESFHNYLETDREVAIADVCFSANTGRSHFNHRLAIIITDKQELANKLAKIGCQEEPLGVFSGKLSSNSKSPKIAFLFTGQGSQYINMGRQLYETQPIFRQALNQCDQILQSYLEKSLLEVIYPDNPQELNSSVINETAYTQPALFAIEYALAQLWQSWGIKPDVVMGHSFGEYVAATIAGVFSLEDGLKLIAHRGRLMQQLPSGDEMVAVMASQEEVNKLIAPYAEQVAIAAINGSVNVVISGKREAIRAISASLEAQGAKTKALQVSHGFHSPLMEPMLAKFREVAQEVVYSRPKVKIISNLTGEEVSEEITSPEYWCRHILSPVQFAAGMKTLQQQGIEVFLEVGSQPILLSMGRQCVSESGQLWLPSMRKEQSDWQQMLESLAQLYVRGVAVNWNAFDANYSPKKVVLPTYPFQRQRYWIEQRTSRRSWLVRSGSGKTELWHPLIGEKLQLAGAEEIRFESYISQTSPRYLQDHRIYSMAIVPASVYLEMALAAGANVLKCENLVLENVDIEQALTIPENEGTMVQVLLTPQESGGYWFQIFSYTAKEDDSEAIWTRHASGKVSEDYSELNSQVVDLSAKATQYPEEISVSEHYQRYQTIGLEYGASFQAITQIRINSTEALGQIELPPELQSQASEYQLHPVLLDACFQVIGAMFAHSEGQDAYLPVSIKRLRVRGDSRSGVWTVVKMLPIQVLEPERFNADLSLLSRTGEEIGQVEGLTLRRTDTLALKRTLQKDDLKSWLYQVSWKAQPLQESLEPDSEPILWLIFADTNGIGEQLAEQLIAKGDSCVLVFVGNEYQQITPQNYQIDPNAPGDYQQLLQDIVSNGEQVHGVVHLWSLLIDSFSVNDHELCVSLEAQSLGCGSGLHLLQALVRYREVIENVSATATPQLWLITKGAQAVDMKSTAMKVQQAPLWGLGKVIALEHSEFNCKCLDLNPLVEETVSNLVAELRAKDRENQIAYRQDLRYVARLERYQSQAIAQKSQVVVGVQPFQLKITEYGVLDNLTLIPLARRSPAAGEVEIQVYATGLNFRDVLNALGMLREYAEDLGIKSTDDLPFGGECAGKIVAVGVGESNFKVGDEVIAVHAIGSFSSFVVVNADFVAKKPELLNFEAAATIPVAFTTADYGLRHLAKIKPGDRILIHAAAGGVGQAAVQIAQLAGATVFATASPTKWDFLKSMGVKHIFNSRNLDFAQQIMEITHGLGVDIVLNSLNGEFISKSLEVLGSGGRFVEIGKIGIWDHEQVKAHRPDVSYFSFDILDIGINHPRTIATILQNLIVEFNSSKLLPLPHKVFSIEEVTDAFRYMAQAKHIGKIVVSQPEINASEAQISADGSYLITGGLGALGQKVAQWLVTQGAKHLVLSGRHSATAANMATIDKWEQLGTQVLVVTADIAKPEDVLQLLHQVHTTMPPLKGIIHAAGVLDDGVLMQQSWERFERVMAPKVLGTWNLHTLTQDLELDFFMCFSSMAALMGSPGQGNYAAANAFIDALMQHRRVLGLPGVSINWGLWSQTGMAAELSQRERERISRLGLETIEPEKGLQVLAQILEHSPAQVGVMPMNWSKWNEQSTSATISPFLSVFATTTFVRAKAKSAFLEQLKATPLPARRQVLEDYVRAQIAKVLGLSSSEQIEPRTRLFELGIDSLMAIELKSSLEASLACSLRSTLLFDYPTLEALIDYLATEVLWIRDSATVSEDVSGRVKQMTLASQETTTQAIAVIGMSCRFPGGAVNPEAFWQLLQTGVDAITSIPLERWDIGSYYDPDPDTPGKMSSRFGGFLDQVQHLDAQFFGISPREAVSLDPQQRLLLEVSWEALEYANQMPEQLYNSPTGVFIGICTNDYTKILERGSAKSIDAYFGTGNALSVAAGRLSYMLGLTGPSLAIDTACSSSLVSVHLACQSLRQQECRMALAGGVNLILSPETTIAFSKARMLATDGRCKTFDAAADGYVRSEGCGIIVLKRLEDALADGDSILALIRGSAVNQDGASGGLTVPSGLSQERVIRQALASAQVDPAEISYIEAHGTGTSLGDPIEISALASVFGKVHSEQQPLMVGSVKTNIGHTEGAAGIAGLMKVILALQHQEIPPHLHFQEPSPYIDWEHSGVMVVQTPTPWIPPNENRLAGVSSFGFSGTNAHIVLEEAPQAAVADATQTEISPPLNLLLLSAKTPVALTAVAQAYQQYLADHPQLSFANVCHTSYIGRSVFSHRLAVVAADGLLAQQRLAAFSAGESPIGVVYGHVPYSTSPKIAFLFTGQGSQYVDMGRQLYQSQPVFRQALQQCDDILRAYLEYPLLEVIYPSNEISEFLSQTEYTQPALFAIGYALFQLWQSWGIKPEVVIGHSVGEYVAATCAGVFSLSDGLKLIAARGRFMQVLPQNGEMVAVLADLEQVTAAIAPYEQQVSIAAFNGPRSFVISGEQQGVKAVCTILEAQGIKTKALQVSHAFHSPLMEPMVSAFRQVAQEITFSVPQVKFVSNVTGQLVSEEITSPEYWCRHILSPVQFAASMKTVQQQGIEVFLEVGSQPILLSMGQQCVSESRQLWLPSMRKEQSDWQQMLESLAQLYVRGVAVDWKVFDADYSREKVVLPTYPFQRQRYWIETNEYQHKNQDTLALENNSTQIFNLLNQGETEALAQKLKLTNNFSPEQLQLLPELLSVLVKQHQQELAFANHKTEIEEQLKASDSTEREQLLISYFQEVISQVLRMKSSEIDVQQPLNKMGIDSLMAIELRDRLQTDLAVNVPIIKFIEDICIVDLATEVNGQMTQIKNIPTLESENNKQTVLSDANNIDWVEGEL